LFNVDVVLIIVIELKNAWMAKDCGIEGVGCKRVVIDPKSIHETSLIVARRLLDHMGLV
jgi:hypothetical protein